MRMWILGSAGAICAGLVAMGCGDSRGGRDPNGGGIPPVGGGDGSTGATPDSDSAAESSGSPGLDESEGSSGAPDDDEEDGDGSKFDLGSVPDVGVGGGPSDCVTDPDADFDADGFPGSAGDCNDCDANINPGAIEVVVTEPGEDGMVPPPADEDCDGGIDNVAAPCDDGLALDDTDPMNAARSVGLCQTTTPAGPSWGVLSATYVRSNGTALPNIGTQTGLLSGFGPNVSPRNGERVLVLSTGRSRIPGQPNVCNSVTCNGVGGGTAPPGFPQDPADCPVSGSIYDDVALEVTLKAPTNATGYAFDFSFYSFEYPQWVCDDYNDQFIALVQPAPAGAVNGNISFDAMLNPVSVNIAFFSVCDGCPLGTAELDGTGFDEWDPQGAGATSWLETTAPVTGGQTVTIRFAIWDTGDQRFDSTVLIDNFRWIADGGTVDVGTTPTG